jgi:hypothetical protein
MKIKVEPLLPTSPYLNVRLGIEKDILDDADIKKEILSVWDTLTSIHKEKYPNLYNEVGEPLYEACKGEEMKGTHVRTIPPAKSTEEQIIEDIENCPDLETLGTYGRFQMKNAAVIAAYDLRYLQLNKK